MKLFRKGNLIVLGLCLPYTGPADSPAEPAGEKLAEHLRQLVPTRRTMKRGEMRIRFADGHRERHPVLVHLVPGNTTWTNIFESLQPGDEPSVRLTIVRHPEQDNEYLVSTAPKGDSPFGPPQRVTDITYPFLDSDFWLAELGFDFLYWPEHRIIDRERKRYRLCDVLECTRPVDDPSGYARVLAWVDVEHRVVIHAEAYDAAGERLKEYYIGSLREVDGRIQVSEIEMVNYRRDSKTTIRFSVIEY